MKRTRAIVLGLVILSGIGCATPPCADLAPAVSAETPVGRRGFSTLRTACAGLFGPCVPRRYFSLHGYDAFWDRVVVHDAAACNARRAYRKFCRATDSRYSAHFRDGFCSAYMNYAEGFPPETPPVPPAKYWSAHFRTPKGHAHAAEWYAGYESGMACAQTEPLAGYNVVPAEAVLEREGLRPAGPPLSPFGH